MADLSELKVDALAEALARDSSLHVTTVRHHLDVLVRAYHRQKWTITEVMDPDSTFVRFGPSPGDLISCHEDGLTVVQAGESRG